MSTREEFAIKLKERGASVEQSKRAFSLYREKNGFFDDEKPESLAPSFNSRIDQTPKEDVYAANKLYLNSKMNGVSQNEYQRAKEVHTGVDDASDEQAYTMYQDVGGVTGKVYEVVYTITKYVGTGSCTVSMGSGSGTARTSDGEYSERITSSGTNPERLTFTPAAGATSFNIDFVRILRLT